jgi:phosphonatase-like hydrolase
MKIACVVFDMAGTTIDEDNIVYKTLLKAISEDGVALSLEDVLEHGAGKEKLNAIQDILSIYGTPEQQGHAELIFANFLSYLENAYNDFPIKEIVNAEEVLKSLRKQGIVVVLNTGYDKNTASKLLDKINWKENVQYDLLVTASDVVNSRPSPDMIIKAMNHFSITDASSVVKVGDSVIDIEEGKNANCLYTIGVTTGAQTREQIAKANPTNIFNNLNEVLDFVNGINSASSLV